MSGTSFFTDSSYYRLVNKAHGPNETLSSGISMDAKGALEMNTIETYSSSENWQFLFQEGRYFIRNYDYKTAGQLGLNSAQQPQILGIAADLSQQWLIEMLDDGSYRITNEDIGDGQALGLASDNDTPQMTSDTDLAYWIIDPNESAGTVPSEMLVQMRVVQPESSSTTASTSTSSTSSQSTPTPTTASPTIDISGSTGPTSGIGAESSSSSNSGSDSASGTSTSSSEPSSLSPGAIAGIAIAAAALLLATSLILFFLRRRRRQRSQTSTTVHNQQPHYKDSPMPSTASGPASLYAHPHESSTGGFAMPQKQPAEVVVYYEKSADSELPPEMESPLSPGRNLQQLLVELDGNATAPAHAPAAARAHAHAQRHGR